MATADPVTRVRRLCAPLSEPQLRTVLAAVDVLTCIKGWSTQPTAALVQRKVRSGLGQLEGDEEALRLLVESAFLEAGVRLGLQELEGVRRAVCDHHLADVAEELAHVHARGSVVSDEALVHARWTLSHALRLARECRTMASIQGIPMIPIATDTYLLATEELGKGEDHETAALELVGVDGAAVLDGFIANEKGLLIGTALCTALADQAGSAWDLPMCCGTCFSPIGACEKLPVCRRCGDHIVCGACLAGDGPARHAHECARVRSMIRDVVRSTLPRVRGSARRVAIVRLDEDGGMVAPMHVKGVASPLVPSSLLETVLGAAPAEEHQLVITHWRLLVALLAESDDDDDQSLEAAYGATPRIRAAAHALECDDARAARKPPGPLPSEKRKRLKAKRAGERRAREDARAAAAAAAVAEADAVLERQMARPDAQSTWLTRVIAKREGTASADVVARARAKRDVLKAEERAARRPTKQWQAPPERASAAARARREGAELAAQRAAAVFALQRHVRAWLRGRRKARRKLRSRAAKLIQRRARAWLRPPTPKAASLEAPATPAARPVPSIPAAPPPPVAAPPPPPTVQEGDDDVSCVVCLARPRAVVILPCRHLSLCALCAAGVPTCPMCRGAVEEKMGVFV